MEIRPPDITATEVELDSLDGTALSVTRMAVKAGYTVRATRALGMRVPRIGNQRPERIGTLALAGTLPGRGWSFIAYWNARDGWDCVLTRPGWPTAPTNILELRTIFKAQTAAIGDTAA